MKISSTQKLFAINLLLVLVIFSGGCDDDKPKNALISVYQGNTKIENTVGVYDFGYFNSVTTPSEITFTIKNDGNSDLLLIGTPKIEIIGTNSNCFVINDTATSSSIVPDVSTTFTIKFDPVSTGDKVAFVSILNNDEDNSPFIFKITGRNELSYEWTRVFGYLDNTYIKTIKTDSYDNLYIAGTFFNEFNIGSIYGVSDKKTSVGREDIFITKLHGDNSYGWTRIIGSTNSEDVNNITVDSAGNIYLTGVFNSAQLDFGKDFGVSDVQSQIGDQDFFVTKILSNGDYGWTRIFGGIESDSGRSVNCDLNDDLYIGCNFRNTVNFGAAFSLSDVKTAKGQCDNAVIKIYKNGDYAWTKQIGTLRGLSPILTAFDSQNNVYVYGNFCETIDFGADFGVNDIKIHGGGQDYDLFITKITENCNYLWTKIVNTSINFTPISIKLDSSDNIYLSGEFMGQANFAGDFGGTDFRTFVPPTSSFPYMYEKYDVFVMRINSDKSYGFVRQIGNEYSERPSGMIIDSRDNLFIAGTFTSELDFGADFGVSDKKSVGGKFRSYFTGFGADATYYWTKDFDAQDYVSTQFIDIDGYNNIYIVGKYCGSVDFGKSFSSTDVKTSSTNLSEYYILKLQG